MERHGYYMRYVSLKDAKAGMCLAFSLYDSYGRMLIGEENILTDSYIKKLGEYGFAGVYIIDKLSEDIEIEPAISPALKQEGMVCVRECNVEGCISVAKRIVEYIVNISTRSLDMTDMRSYDDYTYAHSVNVAVISCVIGLGMGMKNDELEILVTAALLHDFGKLSIPKEILNKPGRLSQEEYQIMKSHASLSYEAIRERWDLSAYVKTAVLHHHENVDGSGYPEGTEGASQTVYTKILHVADVYDALVSKRPYKNPYSPYAATEYLMSACGTMFDQKIVELFLKYVPLYPIGTKIILSDGREGIIYDNSGYHNLRPIVRLMDMSLLDLYSEENLSLTFRTDQDEEEQIMRQNEEERQEMVKTLRRYHILVVDDTIANLHALKGMLEHIYDVTLLKSGNQAILYLKKNSYPDLILMDVMMPEMDGVETAKRIQEMAGGNIPILFVSEVKDRDVAFACRQMNAAGYIVRPFQPVFIKSEIKRILTGHSDAE